MHTNPYANSLLDSCPASAYSVTSLHYSPGLENHLMSLQLPIGFRRVWGFGTHHHLQRAIRKHQTSMLAKRSGCLQRICVFNSMLSPQYIGPFTIEERINSVTHCLHLPPKNRIHPMFHISLLKPYHLPVHVSTEPGPREEPLSPILVEEGSIY